MSLLCCFTEDEYSWVRDNATHNLVWVPKPSSHIYMKWQAYDYVLHVSSVEVFIIIIKLVDVISDMYMYTGATSAVQLW